MKCCTTGVVAAAVVEAPAPAAVAEAGAAFVSEGYIRNMAQLQELAKQYQQDLDRLVGNVTSAAAEASGRALYVAMHAPSHTAGNAATVTAHFLRPLVLGMTLATSVVKYLEHIPWRAVSPQMLSAALGPTPDSSARLQQHHAPTSDRGCARGLEQRQSPPSGNTPPAAGTVPQTN